MSGKTSGSARSSRKKRVKGDFSIIQQDDSKRQWKELRNKRLYGNFKSVSSEQIKRYE